MKSFEEMEKVLSECVKNGFSSIPIEKRVKQLEEQRKRIEESEKCYKTDRKQLERQFTL
jgi:hypothetical protein